MDFCADIIENEKDFICKIQTLTANEPVAGEEMCTQLLLQNADKLSESRAVSGVYARCICSCLLHKKNKSRLIDIIKYNVVIRNAFFGKMNTYKYSVIFVLKRVLRLNDVELAKEIIDLLKNNPFRDDNAKSYSDRWSFNFLMEEIAKVSDDYLNLSEEMTDLLAMCGKTDKIIAD